MLLFHGCFMLFIFGLVGMFEIDAAVFAVDYFPAYLMVLVSTFLQFACTVSAFFLVLCATCKAFLPKAWCSRYFERYFEPRPPTPRPPVAFISPATEKTRCFRKKDGCRPVGKACVLLVSHLLCGPPFFCIAALVAMFCWFIGWAFPKCIERALASSSALRAVYGNLVPRSRDSKLVVFWRAYWRASSRHRMR